MKFELPFFIAEIGINHNGDLNIVKKLIDNAIQSGFNAVKFQKRDLNICIPDSQKNILRETPWGIMKYIDYKKRLEFSIAQYDEINRYCKKKKIEWFASCWDLNSQKLMRRYKFRFINIDS